MPAVKLRAAAWSRAQEWELLQALAWVSPPARVNYAASVRPRPGRATFPARKGSRPARGGIWERSSSRGAICANRSARALGFNRFRGVQLRARGELIPRRKNSDAPAEMALDELHRANYNSILRMRPRPTSLRDFRSLGATAAAFRALA